MELWLPDETISVTTTHYTNGESAQTIHGQYRRVEVAAPKETGFRSPVAEGRTLPVMGQDTPRA